jgi:hypothetical protein
VKGETPALERRFSRKEIEMKAKNRRPHAAKRKPPATARKMRQAGPLAAKVEPPASEAPKTEDAAAAPPVAEVEAITLPGGKVDLGAEADADETQREAMRLSYALSKKPNDRRRALALVEFVDKHPAIERNSLLHGRLEAATRLLAETPAPVAQKRGEVQDHGGARNFKLPDGKLEPSIHEARPAKDSMSDGALLMLRAVVGACGGAVNRRVDYATVETPNLTVRQRTGFVAVLLKRGFLKTYWAPRPRIEVELTEAGVRASAAQADG